jgi:hypothetical protein
MKVLQTCLIIFIAKMYVVFRVYGQQIDLTQLNRFVQHFINITKEGLMSNEL